MRVPVPSRDRVRTPLILRRNLGCACSPVRAIDLRLRAGQQAKESGRRQAVAGYKKTAVRPVTSTKRLSAGDTTTAIRPPSASRRSRALSSTLKMPVRARCTFARSTKSRVEPAASASSISPANA